MNLIVDKKRDETGNDIRVNAIQKRLVFERTAE